MWPKQWKKLRNLIHILIAEFKVNGHTCYPFLASLLTSYLWEFNWPAEQEDIVLLFTNSLTVPWVVNTCMLYVDSWCWTSYVVFEQFLDVSVLALVYFHGVVSEVVCRWEEFYLMGSKAIVGEDNLQVEIRKEHKMFLQNQLRDTWGTKIKKVISGAPLAQFQWGTFH